MKNTIMFIITLYFFTISAFAQSPAAAGAKLYFISPANGDTVSNPVTVVFGLRNMGIAPAGIEMENTGHHHLLVDTGLPDLNAPVPTDDNHRHFGKGQSETNIELKPGEHSLQLLLGDFTHTPHQPPVMSEKITITVK